MLSLSVGIDVSPLGRTRAGTARYVERLLAEFHGDRGISVRPLAFPGGASAFGDLAWYPVLLPLRSRGVDVLHCPGIRAPFRSSVPLVVTVHDVAVLRHPEAFPAWSRRYSRFALPRVVRAARRVIADSEFTKRELVELLGADATIIRVVPLAAAPAFQPEGPAAQGRYALAVGTLEPRKNLARLSEAAGRAGIELRVVGERGWGGVEPEHDGLRWLGRVPDEELARLYRGALCVAYPSLYEGFGLPVLEAMACGAPVVTSATGATAEIAGDAAVLVDPFDPAAIAAGIEEANDRREELSRRGIRRAASFSWRATAEATVAVYREAVV
jgi:glycosyltransferase involved in cell wall biosynthesis